MEKYLIYYNYTDTCKKYITTIQRTNTYTSEDTGDAIEMGDKETALKTRDYINEREKTSKYKVMCIKTTTEEVVE